MTDGWENDEDEDSVMDEEVCSRGEIGWDSLQDPEHIF